MLRRSRILWRCFIRLDTVKEDWGFMVPGLRPFGSCLLVWRSWGRIIPGQCWHLGLEEGTCKEQLWSQEEPIGEHPAAHKTLGGHSGCLGACYVRPAAALQQQADSSLSYVPYDMYVRLGARGDCGVEISSKEAKIIDFGAGMLSQKELWSACRSSGVGAASRLSF